VTKEASAGDDPERKAGEMPEFEDLGCIVR